jgi:choline kinase
MQCAILAGGLATRLQPVTATLPKALVPIAGRPFADHQLGWLASEGVTDVVYCIGHLGEQIRAFAGDGMRWGLRIRYVDEGRELRGTAGALRLAYDAAELEPAFAVLYGDSFLEVDIRRVRASFDDRRPPALMTVFRNQGRFDRSNAQLEAGWVVRFDKRAPNPAAEGMDHIDYGLSIIDPTPSSPTSRPTRWRTWRTYTRTLPRRGGWPATRSMSGSTRSGHPRVCRSSNRTWQRARLNERDRRPAL